VLHVGGERRGIYRILVGKAEGSRQLGRQRHRREDNIKKELQEVGCVGIDWIELVQGMDRSLVSAVMKVWFP
jgi:hypothetical protein